MAMGHNIFHFFLAHTVEFWGIFYAHTPYPIINRVEGRGLFIICLSLGLATGWIEYPWGFQLSF